MREVISTKDAPQAIGPYSQAIKANGFIFVSGQVAIDPATQQVITGAVAAQTDRVLRNLSEILEAAGSGLGKAPCRLSMVTSGAPTALAVLLKPAL